ncbi:TonB-dependent receptor [Opitutaceae bacterium EW11]|nr:TonB-dependent receptor [Opitutaceae bacterium EW11]
MAAPFLLGALATSMLAQAAPSSSQEPKRDAEDETIVLSPFEVKADTRGYYSANTMSGTRFNAKLDDLASAITVVSKEQMQDFAMLDINDVFMYTASTEGTATYTDYVVDRNGSVQDNVQLNPTGANRVRGIAPANVSLNNIESMNRVAMDPILLEGVEISRGPNANVFGLGNPSGTVNQILASANLQRDRNQVQLRVDDWGGFRSSLDANRVLLNNKLAVRVSAVYQNEAFTRKPSGVKTERYNAMVKYQPFKGTSISGGVFYYHMYGNRPNALPPRDDVSYWLSQGSPTWDPVTRTIHVNGTSRTLANPTNGSYPSSAPDFFNSGYLGSLDSQLFIDQNGIGYWAGPMMVTGANPSTGATLNRFLQASPYAGITGSTAKPSTQPLFTTIPSLTDKSIYDWSSINLASVNNVWDTNLTSYLQIDQTLLNSPRNWLVVQFAYLGEDSKRYQRNLLGTANDNGVSGLYSIDINERLLDGTPNPYFLRPYISTDKPRTVLTPAKWETYRAQVAYRLDLTQESGFLKWLGMHQFTAYDEYKYRINRQYSYRDVITNGLSWITPGVYRGNQSQVSGTPALIATTRSNYRYYVGDNVGNNVDYAPVGFDYGSYPYVWGNYTTGAFTRDPATLGLGAVTDATGYTNNSKVILKTMGAVMQNHWLNDSIVTTVGIRRDKVFTKFGYQTVLLNPDGLTFNTATTDSWAPNWRSNTGDTKNYQIAVRPFRELPFAKQLEGGTGFNHYLGGFLRSLNLYYNKSDSFIPSTPAQDLFLNKLPDPSGEDKSWGVGFTLLDNKLNVRITHYKNSQLNSRNSDANTMAQRIIRHDLPLAGTTPARYVLYNVAGATVANSSNYNRIGWIKADPNHPERMQWSDEQVMTELENVMGMSRELMQALINPDPPIAATNDVHAKGTEVEVNFNPNRYWTLTGSFTEGTAQTDNISLALQQWIDQRMQVWTKLKDPTVAATAANPDQLWWKTLYPSASQTPEQNFISWIQAPYGVIKQLEGKSNPSYRRYNVKVASSYQLAGITDNHIVKNFTVGGAVRWESKGAIGYYGLQTYPATITDLDASRPIYDSDHIYFDGFITYKTKLFRDKIRAAFQLNVRNIQESGRLQPVGAYPNGVAHTYRIVDPRQFIFQTTFEF